MVDLKQAAMELDGFNSSLVTYIENLISDSKEAVQYIIGPAKEQQQAKISSLENRLISLKKRMDNG